MDTRKVRVRFAPSPTGALHIGGVRTALYNYLFARQHDGDMLLRIEDTDSTRFVPGAEEYILESLRWLGIEIDEGLRMNAEGKIESVGEHGPYRQSERRDIYWKYVQQLLDEHKAYLAFDTPEQLEAKRKEIPNFQYDATTRNMMDNSLTCPQAKERFLNGEPFVVRFLVEPDEDIVVHDLIRGDVTINSNILDDKVLYKFSDRLPTYHLANIVDDHLMGITHVIRGEEWLPSAPLHVLLYKAFGWDDTMPQFAHLPLLLKPDGNGKLSKRDGDRLGFPVFPLEFHNQKDGTVSSGYRESGYYPEAVINFLALLGWHASGDQEMFSMDELISQFSLERVSKSGAKFDYEKCKWFNHQYLQLRSNEQLAEEFRPILVEKIGERAVKNIGNEKVAHIIGLMKERVSFVSELWEQCNFFFVAPEEYDEKSLKKRWKEDSPQHMKELLAVLKEQKDWSAEALDATVLPWIEEKGYGLGIVMNAFRICLVGAARGPHIWAITDVLGKDEVIRRVEVAIKRLQ
ncbi:MAG: glutamate--tRNA ligase [Paludibacteraceae bacterium]|nr:glutamate--tRNA ligase [Paludibacteraceae bacterium]